MKKSKITLAILVFTIVAVMMLSLVACGPSKNPEDVKKLLTKSVDKANFTMEMYDEGKVLMYIKFDGNKMEALMQDTVTIITYDDKKVQTYIQDNTDKKFFKIEEDIPAGMDYGKEFKDEMMTAVEEFDASELAFDERLGGFVGKEVLDDPDNTMYMVLDKGVLTIYSDDAIMAVLKDVGKTKIALPANKNIKTEEE